MVYASDDKIKYLLLRIGSWSAAEEDEEKTKNELLLRLLLFEGFVQIED